MTHLICWLFNHDWDTGFTETRCRRCNTLKIDRLYQTGIGEGPSPEYTPEEEFSVLAQLALWSYACMESDMVYHFRNRGLVAPDKRCPDSLQHGTLTASGRERLVEVIQLTAPQGESA